MDINLGIRRYSTHQVRYFIHTLDDTRVEHRYQHNIDHDKQQNVWSPFIGNFNCHFRAQSQTHYSDACDQNCIYPWDIGYSFSNLNRNFEWLEISTYLHSFFIYTRLRKTSMHIVSIQLSVFLYFNILMNIEVQTSTLIDKGNQ